MKINFTRSAFDFGNSPEVYRTPFYEVVADRIDDYDKGAHRVYHWQEAKKIGDSDQFVMLDFKATETEITPDEHNIVVSTRVISAQEEPGFMILPKEKALEHLRGTQDFYDRRRSFKPAGPINFTPDPALDIPAVPKAIEPPKPTPEP